MTKMVQSHEKEASDTESRQKLLKERQVQEAAREEVEWRQMRMNLTTEKRKGERRRNQRFKQRRKRRKSRSQTLEVMTISGAKSRWRRKRQRSLTRGQRQVG